MKQIAWLSPKIVEQIKRLFREIKYSSAYDVIINNTDLIHYDGKKWFIAAVGVNRREGYASSFIRTYTQIAKRILAIDRHQIPNNNEIDYVSNKIAHTILTRVIKNEGLLPTFDQLQLLDYEITTTELNLQPLQWAGTPFGVFPGCHSSVPHLFSDWTLVLRATEYAIFSALYEGTANYIKIFFDHSFSNTFSNKDATMNTKQHFKMLYDGDCPICRAEVKWLTRWNKEGYLKFEDISKADTDENQRRYGKSKQQLLDRIHGVTEQGKLIDGVEVFRKSYDSVGLG